MLDGAGQLVAVSRIPVSMAGLGVVSMVSDMGQSPQDVLKKRNRPNARQLRQLALLSRTRLFAHLLGPRVTICAASLQERLGLTTKDAEFSAVWLTRD